MDQELKEQLLLSSSSSPSWLVISNSTIILSSILLLLISLLTFHRIKQWKAAATRNCESIFCLSFSVT